MFWLVLSVSVVFISILRPPLVLRWKGPFLRIPSYLRSLVGLDCALSVYPLP